MSKCEKCGVGTVWNPQLCSVCRGTTFEKEVDWEARAEGMRATLHEVIRLLEPFGYADSPDGIVNFLAALLERLRGEESHVEQLIAERDRLIQEVGEIATQCLEQAAAATKAEHLNEDPDKDYCRSCQSHRPCFCGALKEKP